MLAVKGEDALLFNGTQFVEAHGLGINQEKVFWNYGNYYNELPTNIFTKEKKSIDDIKETLNSFIENNYEDYIKAVISIEKDITDDGTLTEMYNKYMESDVNLLNDYFDEIEYDMDHDNRIGESLKDEYDYEMDKSSKIENLDKKITKELEGFSSENKYISLKKGKLKEKVEIESKGDVNIKRKSLLGELKSNRKKDKSKNINKKIKENIEL